jgi:colicin import membrane protein
MISPRWHRAGYDGDTRFRRMLAFSAFIHLLLLGFFISSTNVPAPKWTFGPVYSVQLVSLSDQMVREKASSSISREILQPRPAPPAIILRKPVETTAVVPLKKTEAQKAPAPSIEKALDAIRDKVKSSPKPPSPAASQSVQTDKQTGQADAGGRMDPYYAQIWSRIRGQWSLPQEILPKGNVETVINVRILRNGAVVDVGFEKKSGNRYFDESAVRAIKKASPLPPLPSWIRGDTIEVGIRFRSAELR